MRRYPQFRSSPKSAEMLPSLGEAPTTVENRRYAQFRSSPQSAQRLRSVGAASTFQVAWARGSNIVTQVGVVR